MRNTKRHENRGWAAVRIAGVCLAALLLCRGPAAGSELGDLLERTGNQVEFFWREFPAVACTETIEQWKYDEKERVVNERKSVNDYITFLQLAGNDLKVEESRVPKSVVEPRKKKRPQHRSLLVTDGFSILILIFHPRFQNRFEFTMGPETEMDGRTYQCIDFKQLEGSAPLSILRLKNRDLPIEWRGRAWIDPASGRVVRIRTDLGASLADVGLEQLTSDVSYSEVTFVEAAQTMWLPEAAQVEARTAHQHWRNLHQFTDYRKFSVNTDYRIGEGQ